MSDSYYTITKQTPNTYQIEHLAITARVPQGKEINTRWSMKNQP